MNIKIKKNSLIIDQKEKRSKYKNEFDWKNVQILDHEPLKCKHLVTEMIPIKLQKNSVNRKEDIINFNKQYDSLLR